MIALPSSLSGPLCFLCFWMAVIRKLIHLKRLHTKKYKLCTCIKAMYISCRKELRTCVGLEIWNGSDSSVCANSYKGLDQTHLLMSLTFSAAKKKFWNRWWHILNTLVKRENQNRPSGAKQMTIREEESHLNKTQHVIFFNGQLESLDCIWFLILSLQLIVLVSKTDNPLFTRIIKLFFKNNLK